MLPLNLSPTENKVVRLISLGCSTGQIAVIVGKSRHTVARHRERAMWKLCIHNVPQLTRWALQRELTSLADCLSEEETALLRTDEASRV